MSDVVADSSVVAKWVLPEADTPLAERVLTDTAAAGGRVIVLDLALVEVANAIWKRCHRKPIAPADVPVLFQLLTRHPLRVEPALPLVAQALDVATRYDRAVYDALFVALARQLGVRGVTADDPLAQAVQADYPEIVRLQNW
jgi:predicted nucleic acid-binding protein